MGSMKDALLKAGLRPANQENERQKRPAKGPVTKSVIHQETRNFCEHCQNIAPDVENYRHKNPTTRAQWICLACADRLEILDDCRVSNQSDTAKKNMFRRFFGPTKKFGPGGQGGGNPHGSGHGGRGHGNR